MNNLGHPDQWFGGQTFSQHGEDLLFCSIFHRLGIQKPSYIDIGCNHPVNISNTALLYSRGSRGMNVDANPNVIKLFLEQRPGDVSLSMAVGEERGTAKLYMIDDFSGRNTIVKSEAEKFVKENPGFIITEEIEVEVVTLDDIMDAVSFAPDLLTMDIEGMDVWTLRSCNFLGKRPKVICAEAGDGYGSGIKAVMNKRGYAPLVRMGENLVFVDENYIGVLR